MDVAVECDHDSIATKLMRKRGLNHHRKSLRRVRKLRRTMTESSLVSSAYQLELSHNWDCSSDESEDDETIGI